MHSPEDLANLFNVSKRTIQRILHRGEIRSILVGGQRRITQEELDAYVKRQSHR